MNKVFVSGIIAGEPALRSSENGMAHLIFPLSVRHRTMNGMMRQEIYTINAWNNPAIWGKENLRVGNLITVQGYLTQHSRENGVLMTEVTAEEFLLGLKPAGASKKRLHLQFWLPKKTLRLMARAHSPRDTTGMNTERGRYHCSSKPK